MQRVDRPTFIENSRISRRVFQITGDYLEISGSVCGQKMSQRVLLRSLDPAFRYSIRREHLLLMIHAALFVILLRLAMWGLADGRLPAGPRGMLLHVLGMPMLALMAGMIIAWPKFEYFYFADQWGKNVFFILREQKQKAECTAFLEELVAQIETPGQTLYESSSQRTGHDGVHYRHDTQPGWFWKAALIGGIAATVFPWLPGLMKLIEPWAFILVFSCTVVGAGMGVMSLISKESMRLMAVLGIVLSLIPVFFY